MPEKPKLSLYWASSCGGCEVAVVNLHEKILDVDANFNFMFCPCLLDTKKKDIEALPDGDILITLFNGAIRTSENEEMARLLRRKSKIVIAFGACSSQGGVPGLANLHSKNDIMKTVYLDNPTIDNPEQIIPRMETATKHGTLRLPEFYDKAKPLSEVADVDFYIPGCPPEPAQIWNVVNAVVSGAALPPKGSVIGGGKSAVCDECERKKEDKRIAKFHRTFEIIPEKEACLLEQGLICMGIATRSGCGALCPKVNMPCTGCYGPPEGVLDQGAKIIAALGSVIDIGDPRGLTEDEINRKIDDVLSAVPDFAGSFYKYSLPGSIMRGKIE